MPRGDRYDGLGQGIYGAGGNMLRSVCVLCVWDARARTGWANQSTGVGIHYTIGQEALPLRGRRTDIFLDILLGVGGGCRFVVNGNV